MFSKLFQLLKPEASNTASIAKERLQIVVAHHRKSQSQPDFVKDLQRDILAVLSKYVEVNQDQVQISMERDSGQTLLELNVTLPESEYTE